MDELLGHPKLILEVLAGYWLFSAIVTSMPKPPAGSFWYSWLFDALHVFAGNVSKFADSRLQALESTTVTVTKKTEGGDPPKQ